MKQSHLAFICGFLLLVIFAISWCGRKPQPEIIGVSTPVPTPTSSPVAAARPTTSPSASPQLAQISATPNQAPLPDFRKVADKIAPAVILISVFDLSGQLLRSGTGFFVSADGQLITDWHIIEGGAHAVAKSADGKIRNVSGILASSDALDLAVLKADTKAGVPFVPLSKVSATKTGTPVAVFGSRLARREQPLTVATIFSRESDQPASRLEISTSLSNDADGAPVVDENGEVVGVVTSSREQGPAAKIVRPSNALDPLLAQIKPGATGRWAAVTTESPSPPPSPSPQPSAKALADNRKLKLVYQPSPKYPTEARFARVSGSGRFRIVFSASGEARTVETVQSTGKQILDQAALNGLRQWKSEPGREWSVVVPITFQP